MNRIQLIVPSYQYIEDIERFRDEIISSNDSSMFAGCGFLSHYPNVKDWIDAVHSYSNPLTCPSDKVPSNVYLGIRLEDNMIVGIIDLRHHINTPILSTWGGHIGYSVRPSERRKGYGYELLKLNLINATDKGLEKVLVTCDDDNIASQRTILKNGGIFDSQINVSTTIVNGNIVYQA